MFPPPQAVVHLSLSLIPSFVPNFFLFSLTLSLVPFRHILVFRTPSFSPASSLHSLFLCHVLWFPQLHVLCPCSVSGDTHCASYSSYLRVKKKKKKKSMRSKHCTSRVLAGLKKRRREGDVLTAWREKVGTNGDTTNIVCVSLVQLALSGVSNVILKAWGTEMATWYHATCSSLNCFSYH